MFLGKIYRSKEVVLKVSDMEGAPDTDATIRIKLLTPGERKTLVMSSFKTVYTHDESGEFRPEMISEHHMTNEHLFMKAVVGWDGFFEDAAGEVPLRFGQAGKTKLLSVIPELADFVAEQHGKLVREATEKKESDTKNLLPGSKDSGTKADPVAKGAKP